MLAGGLNDRTSLSAQCIGASPTHTERNPVTRYVNGFTLYIQSQKPRRASGLARMPQKAYMRMERIFERLDAMSGLLMPAISMWANELAKRNVAQMKRNARVLREWTVSVDAALTLNKVSLVASLLGLLSALCITCKKTRKNDLIIAQERGGRDN